MSCITLSSMVNRLEDVRVAPAYPIDEVLKGNGKPVNLQGLAGARKDPSASGFADVGRLRQAVP